MRSTRFRNVHEDQEREVDRLLFVVLACACFVLVAWFAGLLGMVSG